MGIYIPYFLSFRSIWICGYVNTCDINLKRKHPLAICIELIYSH